jgi:hypothetical protein
MKTHSKFLATAVLLSLMAAPCAAQDTSATAMAATPVKADTIARRVTINVGTLSLPFTETGIMADGEVRLGSFLSIGAGAAASGRQGEKNSVQSSDLFSWSYDLRINMYPQKHALRGWIVSVGAGSTTLSRDALLCSPSAPPSCPTETQRRPTITSTVGHQWIIGKKQRWVAGATGGLRAFLGSTWRPLFDYPDVRPILAVKLGVAF